MFDTVNEFVNGEEKTILRTYLWYLHKSDSHTTSHATVQLTRTRLFVDPSATPLTHFRLSAWKIRLAVAPTFFDGGSNRCHSVKSKVK